MDPDRWDQVQALFDLTLELPLEARQDYLIQATGKDRELRHEVETLLAADSEAETPLEDALREGLELLPTAVLQRPEAMRFGKYEVLEEIGEGGFGRVYRGRDPQLERAVAIKTCTAKDAELRQRFFREARIAAVLQHPKIVTIHDFGEEDGLPFLVQELLSGEDLDQIISRKDNLPLTAQIEMLLQIAQGLSYAHGKGILHRDVKPGNIRVLADNQIKILDFGIACLLNEEQRLTEENSAVGTIGYIAPEQLKGRDLDERSDIFSFGVLAYELLAGKRPFQGKTIADVLNKVLHEEPIPVEKACPEIPQDLAQCINRCLEKDPDERFATLREVVEQLKLLLGNSQSSEVVTPPPPQPTKKFPLAMSVGLLVPLVLAIILWFVLSQKDRTAEPSPNQQVAELEEKGPGERGLEQRGLEQQDAAEQNPELQASQSQPSNLESRDTEARGPEERGPEERGPEERGPEERGPEERGPEAQGTEPRALAPSASSSSPQNRDSSPASAPASEPLESLARDRRTELSRASSAQSPAQTAPSTNPGGNIPPGSPGAPSESTDSAPQRLGSTGNENRAALPPETTTERASQLETALVPGANNPTQSNRRDTGQSDTAPEGADSRDTPPRTSAALEQDTPGASSPPAGNVSPNNADVPASGSGSEPGEVVSPAPETLTKPVLLDRPDPRYPALAQRRQKEARVTVAVLVNAQGRVQQALVTRSDDQGLGFDAAAREAALQATFEPARSGGKAVEEWAELTFEFRLHH